MTTTTTTNNNNSIVSSLMSCSNNNTNKVTVPLGIVAIIIARNSNLFTNLWWNFTSSTVRERASLVSVALGFVYITIQSTVVWNKHTSQSSSSNKAIVSEALVPPKKVLDEIATATNDIDKFVVCYPVIRNDILTFLQNTNEVKTEAAQWIIRMMDYTVPGGKYNRGTTVLNVYTTIQQSLHNRNVVSSYEQFLACIAGWSIEYLQAFFLVADDIMDDSVTRRGAPCWYRNANVQLIAINDSFLLESFVFTILKLYYRNQPYYTTLVELLLDVTQKTELGQLLDLTSQSVETKIVDLNRFTMERYKQIVKYKTAYYSFYLPVAMGMILSNITDPTLFQLAEDILIEMGEYFQIQDDYLDCYGTVEIIGKVGTDIQDNKCSWLVIQALERANAEQRTILEQNYGQWDDTKVTIIKELYTTLDLPAVFAAYEESSYQSLQTKLSQIPTNKLPRDVFELLLQKIYKRSK